MHWKLRFSQSEYSYWNCRHVCFTHYFIKAVTSKETGIFSQTSKVVLIFNNVCIEIWQRNCTQQIFLHNEGTFLTEKFQERKFIYILKDPSVSPVLFLENYAGLNYTKESLAWNVVWNKKFSGSHSGLCYTGILLSGYVHRQEMLQYKSECTHPQCL